MQKAPSAVVFGFWDRLVALHDDAMVMGAEHPRFHLLGCTSANESYRDGEKEEKSPLGLQPRAARGSKHPTAHPSNFPGEKQPKSRGS